MTELISCWATSLTVTLSARKWVLCSSGSLKECTNSAKKGSISRWKKVTKSYAVLEAAISQSINLLNNSCQRKLRRSREKMWFRNSQTRFLFKTFLLIRANNKERQAQLGHHRGQEVLTGIEKFKLLNDYNTLIF